MFNWYSFLTYTVITVITPGPNNLMSMSNGNRRGFKKGLPLNFGMFVGFFVVMNLCAVFCTVLSSIIPKVDTLLRFIGAIYILYLAYATWRSSALNLEKNAPIGFVQGALLQFLNPKVFLCGMTNMEGYILPYYGGDATALTLFALLISVFAFTSTVLWSAFGSFFRRVFSEHSAVINKIMAVLLLYCAVSIFM